MALTFPRNTSEFVAMAERAVERLYETQRIDDLFSAVLATVHAADWYFREYHGKKLSSTDRAAFAKAFPAWDTLRQLGNGAKHAGRSGEQAHPDDLTPKDVEWEDDDFWDHAGTDEPYWSIEHQGDVRSVYSLCRYFLDEFKEKYLDSVGSHRAPA